MIITKEIKKCRQCRFVDHSGSFTPGGAKDICQGPSVIEWVAQYKNLYRPPYYIKAINNPKSRYHKDAINYIHWRHRVVEADKEKIPEWCPLKNGEFY